MSTYQYYEFQAIDRPLTAKEQAKIQKLSSRVQPTASSASFVYHYGGDLHNHEQVLAKYFDAMLYMANWGTWQLMFRFPLAIAPVEAIEPYLIEDIISLDQTSAPGYAILNLNVAEEEYGDWMEGEGWLSQLVSLRQDILQGDMRSLYLVYLRVGHYGDEIVKEVEPPIPANLGQLSTSLNAFVEWLEIDPDLVTAAAKKSPRSPQKKLPPLENWIAELSEQECRDFLTKLVRQEPGIETQVINRLKELSGVYATTLPTAPGKRRFADLVAIAKTVKAERHAQEQAEAARKKAEAAQQRLKDLKKLLGRESTVWDEIHKLLEQKNARAYDQATSLVQDLRDLAASEGDFQPFAQRFSQLKEDYRNRPALQKRLAKIKL